MKKNIALFALLLLIAVLAFKNGNAAENDLVAEVVPDVQAELGDGGGVVGSTALFSPKGDIYVTATSTSIELRDVKTGCLIKVMQGGAQLPIVFSPDGKWLLYSLNGEKIQILDLTNGHTTGSFGEKFRGLRSIQVSPTGDKILTSDNGEDQERIQLWDVNSGRLIRSISVACCWAEATFSASGRLSLINWKGHSEEGKVWDLETGEILQTYNDTPKCFINFRKSDALILVRKEKLLLIDPKSGRALSALDIQKSGGSPSVICSQGSQDSIVAFTLNKKTFVWTPDSSTGLKSLSGHIYAISVDGSRALSLLYEGKQKYLYVWDVRNAALLRKIEVAPRGHVGPGRPGQITAASPNLETVATMEEFIFATVGAPEFIDTRTGLITRAGGFRSKGFLDYERYIGLDANGSVLAAGLTWDLRSGKIESQSKIDGVLINGKPLADGSHIGLVAKKGVLKAVNLASGFQVDSTRSKDVTRISAFSSKSETVAFVDDKNAIRLWDIGSGRAPRTINTSLDATVCLSFSPNGRSLAAVGDKGRVLLINADDGRVEKLDAIEKLDWGFGVRAAAFSNGGKLLAVGGDSGNIVLWSLDRSEMASKMEHIGKGRINSLAFSPLDDYLAVGLPDSIVIVETATLHVVRSIERRNSIWAKSLYWTADQKLLGSEGGAIAKVWNATSGQALVTLYSDGEGAWLLMTPEGFYDTSSAKMAQGVSVVRGLEVSSIDQLGKELHRPDLVRAKLAGDPYGKVKLASKFDLNKVMASGSAPRVFITKPTTATSVLGEQAIVDAEVADQDGGIGKVEWRVNGGSGRDRRARGQAGR